MKRLFHNVIWPAIAGNVAWAFFTIFIEANWQDHTFWARLLALLAVAIYLGADWHNTDKAYEEINPSYWIADAFLAPSIALFAITVQAKNSWETFAIALTFIVAIIGHLFGAWDLNKLGSSSWRQRLRLASINFVGLILLGIGASIPSPYQAYSIPLAITIVVALYLMHIQKHQKNTPKENFPSTRDNSTSVQLATRQSDQPSIPQSAENKDEALAERFKIRVASTDQRRHDAFRLVQDKFASAESNALHLRETLNKSSFGASN